MEMNFIILNKLFDLKNLNCLVSKISNEAQKVPIEYKSAALTCLAIYAWYKSYNAIRNYSKKWYASRLAKSYDIQLEQASDINIQENNNLYQIKQKFLYDRINAMKPTHSTLNVVELGYCGSNFKYLPNGCFLTLCNYLPEFEIYLKQNYLKHSRHLWLFNDYFSNNLSQLRPDSVDVVFCTHYLNTVKDIQSLIDQIYRVLKPVSSNIGMYNEI